MVHIVYMVYVHYTTVRAGAADTPSSPNKDFPNKDLRGSILDGK